MAHHLDAKLILVPKWVSEQLQARNLQDSVLLDAVELNSILMDYDVGFFLHQQSQLFSACQLKHITDSFQPYDYVKETEKRREAIQTESDIHKTVRGFSRAYLSVGEESLSTDDLLVSFIANEGAVENTPFCMNDYVPELSVIEPGVFALRIVPLYDPAGNTKLQRRQAYSKCLELLANYYDDYQRLAKTSLFCMYTDLLRP